MMLQRILPFVLTLICGVMLASPASFFNSSTKNVGCVSNTQSSTHDKTWLVIRELPARNYTEQEALEKKALHVQRLRARLNADGTVSDIVPFELVSHVGKIEFTDDVIEAARRIRFIPATEDGKPISLNVIVDYKCSDYHFAHQRMFQCNAAIVEVERDWRTIYE